MKPRIEYEWTAEIFADDSNDIEESHFADSLSQLLKDIQIRIWVPPSKNDKPHYKRILIGLVREELKLHGRKSWAYVTVVNTKVEFKPFQCAYGDFVCNVPQKFIKELSSTFPKLLPCLLEQHSTESCWTGIQDSIAYR